MATLLFKFVFVNNASPQVVLTSAELTGGTTPTVNISTTAYSDGTVASVVAGGALTYDSYTKSWSYLLASANLALYLYTGMATTTYATASPASVHALGIVVPDELVSSRNATTPPTAADNATAAAVAILVTPANKLATGEGGSINSVLGTVDANVVEINGDTDPVANLVLALGSGGLVDKLNSMLEAAGLAYRFTVAALAEAPSEAGSGTGTYTDTIKDPSNNPLDGARVQLSTDAAGAHRVYEAFTNALGVFVMNPDPGTYYRWIDLAGYADRLTQGAQVTVT